MATSKCVSGPKNGEKYDAANYRPVSLTCICCKTLEHILVSNINKHLALDSILADCQHGFRSQRSCETKLVQFVHDVIINLDEAVNRGHKQTDLIIMDFAKAFDKVPHRRLLHKLDHYGEKRVHPQVDQLMALWAHSTDTIRWSKIVSEYDQEIPQSQTTDNPLAPRGRAAQPSRDTRKTKAKQPALSSASRYLQY